jgi:hypothetical protein
MRAGGVVYEWKEGVVAKEIKAFTQAADLRLQGGVGKVLQRAVRVAQGKADPQPDFYERIEKLGKNIYCYPGEDVVMLYGLEGPEQGKKKRAVIILRVARARSAMPSVADVRIAEERLRRI